jgi:DNA repair exonuclease SbcCD ATPase subunit
MKIIRLKINNVLNLRAIDVRPDKHVNKVSGKNAAGKSNLLETIRFSLLGKRAMPPKPLKNGAKKGDIKVDLGDYIVEVKITKQGEYWKVCDKEGNPVKSPQSLLKEIVGPISFDPLALLDEDQKKLRAVLLELVGVNLDEFDTQIAKLREERTVVGRTAKSAKALLDQATWHDDAPKEEVKVNDLAEELRKANETNQQIATVGNNIDTSQVRLRELLDDIERCKEAIAGWQKHLQENTVIDTAPIQANIDNAEADNQKVRDNNAYTDREQAYQKDKDEYDKFTEDIEALEGEKDEALQKARMPVEGLGVDEDGVTFDGIPLEQVNKAKRIEIGTAIHMAMNPKLKVMFVDSNAFDEETEAAIEAAVKDKDYQLFSEVVDDDSETGIHLVDGTIEEQQ